MLKDFPLELFPADGFQIWPAGTDSTGGSALNGPGQVTDWSGGGFLYGEITGIVLHEPAHFLTWRALMLHVRGGGEMVMPVIDDPQRPFGVGGESLGVPFGDETSFSDGTLFQTGTSAFVIDTPALEGDVMVRIRRVSGAPLAGSHWFTLLHIEAGPRAYPIEELGEEDEDGARDAWLGLPLRGDVEAGMPADFEKPRTVVRVISPPSDTWPKLTPPFEATVGFRFAESFNYLDDIA